MVAYCKIEPSPSFAAGEAVPSFWLLLVAVQCQGQ